MKPKAITAKYGEFVKMNDDNIKPPRTYMTIASVEALKAALRDAEPDPNQPISGHEVFQTVANVLLAARKRKITVEQLVKILRNLGLELQPTTVRAYLGSIAKEKKRKQAVKASNALTNPPLNQSVDTRIVTQAQDTQKDP